MNETNELLKSLRAINKKMSYDKIAKEIGVSANTIYRWIQGKNQPDVHTLHLLRNFVEKNKFVR